MNVSRQELERVRAWAREKVATGAEPPWAWYQYMKLRETLDAILAGIDVTTPEMANSQQTGQRPERHLRLVAPSDQQDTVPSHPFDGPVQMPI